MANLRSKTVLVYDYGQFVELAVTLSKNFGRTLYYAPWACSCPGSSVLRIGDGIEGVERVSDMWEHINDVDLVVFPDVYEAGLQKYLVSIGKRVWGCRDGAELELDRAASKEKSKALGIDVPPYKVITGLQPLRLHLEKTKDQFVKISTTRGDMETFHSPDYAASEQRIDELEHTLGAKKKIMEFIVESGINPAVEVGYDGYTIDGKFPNGALVGVETKDKAYVGRTMRYAQLPEQVRSVNEKLAPALKAYGSRCFMSTEIRCKGDKAYLIDPCFSDDTEILTDEGWKLFADLNCSEGVATLNTETGAIEYQCPTDYIANRFTGEMVLISNKEKGIECLVTPNHGVWRTDRHGKGLYRERADSLTDKGYIPRTGRWTGQDIETYMIPSYYCRWVSGREAGVVKEHVCDPVEISMESWLRFLAVYLGDGSIQWGVNITQSDASDKKADVAAVVNALPFNVSTNERGFVINSVQLTEHLRETGFCNEKRVPEFVKELSPRLINVFLDAYRLCDGSEHKGQNLYFTTSKGLADDIQELALKAGRLANIRKRECAGTTLTVGEKTYTRNHDVYVISECKKQNRFWFETGSRADRYFSRQPYDGIVYDVTVPNHTVYVRRNGKPFWSSNCMRMGSPPGELYQVMIENLAEIIWEGSDGVVIEPEYKAKYGAMVFLVSDWANENWQQVEFPPSIRENVKLRNMTVIDGEYYVIPQRGGVAEIGAVVAMGDTAEQAISECKRIAKKVEGYQIETPLQALDEAAANLAKILGTAKKETPLERKAGELRRSGMISDKQYDRMMARG